jgi:glutathione S-transferase
MIFYYGSGSTFAWKVWLALEYKQIPYELRVLSFDKGETRTPAFLAMNPRGKVPAIKDGHFALWESSAIVEYLEEKKPLPSLLPGDAMKRAIARRIAAEADGAFYPPLSKLVSEALHKPKGTGDAATIAKAQTDLGDELARFESYFLGDFLADALSIADFTLYPMVATLGRIARRAPEFSIVEKIGPKMQTWSKRIEALPFFAKTTPPHWKG